jgi:hypothetical protein
MKKFLLIAVFGFSSLASLYGFGGTTHKQGRLIVRTLRSDNEGYFVNSSEVRMKANKQYWRCPVDGEIFYSYEQYREHLRTCRRRR